MSTLKYEVFCDASYYDQWAVRIAGEKRWGHCYHLPSKAEAEGLAEELQGKADWLNADVDTTLALKVDQLERDLAAAQTHLRRIVDRYDSPNWGYNGDLLKEAIQAAKEELSK